MFLIFFLHLLHIYIILFIITKLIAGLAMQSFDLYTYHLFFDYALFYGTCQLCIWLSN